MTTLIAVSGSLRRESANTALLRAAIALAPAGVRIALYEGVGQLPHFNPDNEADPPPAVRALRALLCAADGILVACPEYAHGVPGAFKNMLDWLVGCAELGSKPVALINTSARARHAHAALDEILTTMGWQVIAAASPVIAVANRGGDAAQMAADPALAGKLLAAIEALVQASRGGPHISRDPPFAEAVRAFCQWAEGDLLPGPAQMSIARRHLAGLYAQALDLPQRDCDWGDDAAKVSQDSWRAMFERLGALPVNYYPQIVDPLDVGCNETMMGDLADDLADIWRDLKHGLNLFDGGQTNAAMFGWRENFISHWGSHAASALHILQRWEASQPRDDTGAPAPA